MRDRAALAAAVREAEATFGAVDMMFANAGIARLGDIGRQDPADWDEMIAINVNGVINSVHAVMAGMMQRRHGTLVMMSSIAGRKVYPDHTVCCGTKYFVHGVSESLREYLSDYSVRVVVISPGVIETEVLDGVKDPVTLANYKAKQGRDRRRHRRRSCGGSDPLRIQLAAERSGAGNLHHADPAEILNTMARRIVRS